MPAMTEKWVRDTGLVFALLFLFLAYRFDLRFLAFSASILVLQMFAPKILYPLGWMWLRIAESLAFVMNKIFFGLVFFAIITPVAYLKRIFGEDTRNLSTMTGKPSSLVTGAGKITKEHLSRPY